MVLLSDQNIWLNLWVRKNNNFILKCFAQPHAGIQEFSSGGVQVSLTKKALTFFFLVLSSFYRIQMVNFIVKVPEGVQHFPGGGKGGGSNCLFPIETHITCDFPGGGGPATLFPPLDPHLNLTYENITLTSRLVILYLE